MSGSHHAGCTLAVIANRGYRTRRLLALSCLLFTTPICADNAADPWINGVWKGPALAQPLSTTEVHDLPRHVFADGNGLPEGKGLATDGAVLYAQLCASCHGSQGQGGKALELVGERSLLASEFPDRGIAVFWPNAPTLYEYVYRSMPPQQPASLSANQVYALLAYVLELNTLLAPGKVLDAATLSTLDMPNRQGFRTIAR